MLKRVTFSIYFLSAGVLLTPDGPDECDVVSMLDRSVSCCVMLLASSYRAHVLEKLTDCYAFLEAYQACYHALSRPKCFS